MQKEVSMSETYVECLVKAKSRAGMVLLKYLLIGLTAVFVLLLLLGVVLAIIPGAITGVGAYFVSLYSDLEYEYLYLDKELVIDKVLAKSRRKRVATYQVDRMEIMAPFRSYRLDNYKNRQVKIKDYSIGEELKPDLRYAVYYEGGEKLILSPSEEMVKAIRSVAPRKVFTD
ncbi:MAG: hypothetical protein K2H12_02160 [Acetatifactor sp.]|nr:hypothetical protein [Acetatifactor sp.]MDE5950368.1 hypothetical protein [Acetatifactor sp.]